MPTIKRISRIFRIILQLFLILIPIVLILFWIQAPLPLGVGNNLTGLSINFISSHIVMMQPLTASTKFLGFLITLIPYSLVMLTLYFLISLFNLYEHGQIFTQRNVSLIKKIGYTLLIGQIIHPFYQALLSLALTWHNPVGYRMAMITFSQNNIGILCTAVIVILISHIMAQAHKLEEEQQLTI